MTAQPLGFDDLFDPAFLARVQQFAMSIARAQKGGRLAEQASNAPGQGLDFADFRPYVAGDDLRAIDWNIYRRLGRLFVRVFEERQDMPVHILVDLSRSMFIEASPRIHAAQRLALALGAIALGQQDSIGLYPFSEALSVQTRAMTGKASLPRLAGLIAGWQAGGNTALAAAIEQLAAMRLRQGVAVVISDFFDPAGMSAIGTALGLLRHRLLLVQLIRPEDADPTLNPAFAGELAIEDGEAGGLVEVSITPALLTQYKAQYAAFQQDLLGFAAQRGAALAQIDAGRDVIDQLAAIFANGQVAL